MCYLINEPEIRKDCIEIASKVGFDNERIIKWLSQLLSKMFFSTNAAMQLMGWQVDREVMRKVMVDSDTELKSAVLSWAQNERNALVSAYEKDVIEMLMEAEDEIFGFLSTEEKIVLISQAEYVLIKMFDDERVAELIDGLIERNNPELIQLFVTTYVETHYDYSILAANLH